MSRPPLNIRPTEEQYQLLQEAAERDGKSLAQVAREAIEAALSTPCKRCKGTGKEPSKR